MLSLNYPVAVFGAVYTTDSRNPKGYVPIAETAFPYLNTVAEVYAVNLLRLHEVLMKNGYCKVWTLQKELVVVQLMNIYENNSSRAIH